MSESVRVRLRPGRASVALGEDPCEVQRLKASAWSPCPNVGTRPLVNGKRACRRCFAEAQAAGLPWAHAVTAEPGDLYEGAPPARRRGGRGGLFQAPPLAVVRENRARLHDIMVSAGRIRPADLDVSRAAVETGAAPPWRFSEAAQLLEAPAGKVRSSDIAGVWRGTRRISPGWTYQGQPLAMPPEAG